MEKYLDGEEMNSLVEHADPKMRRNYQLFQLDPNEKILKDQHKVTKRNFKNPEDPFLNKLVFTKNHNNVRDTTKTLSIIQPTDHS